MGGVPPLFDGGADVVGVALSGEVQDVRFCALGVVPAGLVDGDDPVLRLPIGTGAGSSDDG